MNHQTYKSQDDFTCLHVASSSSHQLDDYGVILSGKTTRSEKTAVTTRSEKTVCNDETYVPINFIKPEIYAMIAAWEACELKGLETGESAFDARSEDVCEPMRCMSNSAPPKRFYRSFWRRITQRMLEHSRKSIRSSSHMVLVRVE